MDWTKVLHYGAAGFLVLLGVIGSAGIHLPGVSIDPSTCFAAAVGVFTAGKLGPK